MDLAKTAKAAEPSSVGIHVLGMHRSGTSATTRAINLLGVPTCVESDYMPGLKGNPRGHYESSTLFEINTQLLADQGRMWWRPPPAGAHWPDSALVSRASARDAFLGAHPTSQWVCKDPRSCLTLPFWLEALPGRAAAVIVNRNPLEIAMSLERRDLFPRAFSLALWERHIRSALTHAAGLPVFVMDYDDLLTDPHAWCADVASFLGSIGVHLNSDRDTRVASSLEQGLRHNRITFRELREDPAVSTAQESLYSELRERAGSSLCFEPPALPPEDPSVEARIEGFSKRHRLAMRRIRLTVDSRRADLRRRARMLQSARSRV